MQSRNIS